LLDPLADDARPCRNPLIALLDPHHPDGTIANLPCTTTPVQFDGPHAVRIA